MIAEIETGIISYLKQRWPEFGSGESITEFDINLDFEDITRPISISVATMNIGIKNMPSGCVNIKPQPTLFIVFKDVGKADRRRLKTYPIVETCMMLLTGQDLGLEIDDLRPVSCIEVFHEKLKKMGAVCFQTTFSTEFTVEAIDPEDTVLLLSEQIKYYLGDENTNENATDLLTLQEA